MKQAELKKEAKVKAQGELNLTSLEKQDWILGILIISIAIALFTFCYTVRKDQRTVNPKDLFKDDTAMKEFILNQMVQAH
jgi:hypothetical protein